MDKSRVREIAEANLPAMRRALGVERWKIRLEFGPREDREHSADVSRDTCYNVATIGLDPELQDDEAQVARDLRHELIHLVLAPMDVLYHQLTLGLDGDRMAAARHIWHYAIEQTVLNVETALDNLEAGRAGDPEQCATKKRRPARPKKPSR